ncbi:non-ribosomal peptide synthetase [Actinomadura rubrisoli]|uniref:Amino acid adenylation domain-containing protein n=1 Tax=Actinomadura rubrisoli TaxID=2530368 RepID=A0A4R5CCI6_9ACTN|nr:non-ribosomal peptide synthetase [Actinomadura rubrisoli]TDD94832.1 amino acid adenylation domain-containing protein [Actinomadura rubrisoli]
MGEGLTDSAEARREALVQARLSGRARGAARRRFPTADRSGPIALSRGQQQLWALSQIDPDSVEYLVPLALRLRGPLDAGRLRRAWELVCARHEILRTRYGTADGRPVQLIDPPGTPAFEVLEVAGEDEARRVLDEELARPFDLAAEWPARARLLKHADDDHILLVVCHHIACDAWSMQIICQDLGRAYNDGALPAPEGPQYADYAEWERAELAGPALDRKLGYWLAELDGLEPTELPADRRRPAIRGHAGGKVDFALGPELMDGVHKIAEIAEATPYMVLLAAFQALVSRYTGRADVPVGTVVTGRDRPELLNVVGYCLNSLVMRGRWSGDPGFRDLVEATRTKVLNAYDHQQVPFARLVDELDPERDMSRTPLYQVAFTMHEDRAPHLAVPGIEVEQFGDDDAVAKCDLALQVRRDTGGGMSARFQYATALFDEATVERFAGHFRRLLAQVTADPDLRLSGLRLLDDDELAIVNRPRPDAAARAGATLHEIFEETARRTPDAPAVAAGGTTRTYAEVNARANRIARRLRALGAGPERLVGLCLTRGDDLIPALLGILKSGAGYLPLDPVHPADRLGFMLSDARVDVLVTAGEPAERLAPVFTGRVLAVDADDLRADVRAEDAGDLEPVATAQNLAYSIYTSGSTGVPKGVMVTHDNVARLVSTAQEHFAFGPGDVFSMTHSPAFDVSVFEMWAAFAHGAKLVVVPAEVTRSPEELRELLVAERVTVLSQTPTAFSALAADGPLDLRAVVFAGEKLDLPELRPWAEAAGLDRPILVNMYGITETTVHTTFHRIIEDDLGPEGGNPIGLPLSDLTVRLLDEWGQLVPVGVPGEIHVAGPGVTRGYARRPGLTASRYLPDPFGPPGSRMYRSGDLARWRPDGRLDFLGRADQQIKIRGYRVELGEIEAVLAGHPGVREAVVVKEDRPSGARLVGYLVPDGAPPPPAELAAYCAGFLPDYMVPSAFLALERIPMNANGKLDRKALPAVDRAALRAGGERVAPSTPAERAMAAVWQRVLDVPEVGVRDGFFELGGDSIRAVALVGELRAEGFAASVRDVFAHRTIASLLDALPDREPGGAELDVLVQPFELISDADRARLPEGAQDAYPLSQNQIGMLVEMLVDSGDNLYHNVSAFEVHDGHPFDADAFRAAAATLAARHEVLRTSIDLERYSVPMQVVHASAALDTRVFDLRDVSDPARLAELLEEHSRGERARLFDLGVPGLLRLHVHLTRATGYRVAVTECHPILEGWSHHSLVMELIGLYDRYRDGLPMEEPEPVAVRFADFVAAERRILASEESAGYWRDVLERNARFQLPAGWQDPDAAPGDRYQVSVLWSDLEAGLRELATEAGASLKAVMVSALLKVMSQLTDEEGFYLGLVCDGRPEVLGADRVYGMYLNTVPLVAERSAGTWRELVRATFAREVELWPHRGYPTAAIQRAAGGRERLYQVIFNYQDFHQVDLGTVAPAGDDSPTEFPLTISSRGGQVVLTADPRVLGREHGERIGAMFRAVLRAMATGEGGPRDVWLPEAERARLTGEWAVGDRDPGLGHTLALIEARVAASPNATAVMAGAERLTFGELDRAANRLARRLAEAGAGPDSIVGILLDRSPALLVSVLAVWKTGAAYLPLDGAVPADRIRGMLDDSDVRLLVTAEGRDGFGRHVVTPEDGFGEPTAAVPTAPADLDRLAYVIYTSGSTGKPKGVRVSHRNLATYLNFAVIDYMGRSAAPEPGGAPLFSAFGSDLVVTTLFAPLICGRPVHVLPPDLDPADLGAAIAASGPYDFIKLTPSHLDVLGRQLEPAQVAGLASAVVPGGEALAGDAAARWADMLGPGGRVMNEYGPTEITVGNSTFEVDGPCADQVVPIGRPMPGTTMLVLDRNLEPVPVGVPGELCVGGSGVTHGYGGRPGLTADRYMPDPYGPPGSRLYRTGDITRWRSDGVVEFIGRRDEQVKLRGNRVEPGEIEGVLSRHPAVSAARVVVVEGLLVAYYVPAEQAAETDGDELRRHCAALLPEYMVPAGYVPLERIPLTPVGKVDRAALPAFDSGALSGGDLVEPRTPAEERVAAIWRDVLDLERVGVHDSFFDRGGDSISVVSLVAALRQDGLDVGVRDVFASPTVAELCERLTGRAAPAEAAPPVEPFALLDPADRAALPDGLADAYPLSRNQLGMLIETQLSAEAHYHDISSFLIDDGQPFDMERFRRAVRDTALAHDVLRTSVALEGFSLPLQLVHAEAEIECGLRDLRGLGKAAQDAELEAFVAAERGRLFDLAAPKPLIRVVVHVQSDDAWRCTFVKSHAILDGWSYHLLLEELLDRYRDAGHAPPPVPVRFADVIAAELAALESAEDRDHWRDVTGRPRFTLPADWHGDLDAPAVQIRSGIPYRHLDARLRVLAADAGVPIKSVLAAAFAKVLGLLTGEAEFFAGTVAHTRPEVVGGDRVLGTFLNTLPLPIDRTARTWGELARRMLAEEQRAWPHRDYPLAAMGSLGAAGDGTDRLIDVFFSYLDFGGTGAGEGSDHVVDEGNGLNRSSTEFALGVTALRGYLSLRTHSHALTQANADRIAGLFRTVLEDMAENGADGAAWGTPDDQRGAPASWDASAGALDGDDAVLRVTADPSSIAVVHGDRELDYGWLDVASSWVAEQVAVHAGPGGVVGVRMERSPEMVAALLGVVKAGAAYLPLDPAYPAERLEFMLQDSGAAALLTSAEPDGTLPAWAGPTVVVEPTVLDGRRDASSRPDEAPRPGPAAVTPEHPAYVMYTSGSTGRPKAIVVPHRAVVRLVRGAGYLALGADSRFAHISSTSFDSSTLEVWGPLLNGGRIVILDQETVLTPAALAQALRATGTTHLWMTATLFNHTVREEPAAVASVGTVLIGGEALDPATVRNVQRTGAPGRLLNGYGPTENTTFSTVHDIGEVAPDAASIPIGRLIPGTTGHVVDADLEPAVAGVPGELVVGGAGLAHGYLGRPAETAERFVPDPHGPPGARLYRTGDLVRRLPDGTLDFLGRLDQQIKLRGYRIETGEITAALTALPGVAQAVVTVIDDRLIAYYVPDTEGSQGQDGRDGVDAVTPRGLRAGLDRALPAHLVPAGYVAVDAIPVTVNGKLDRDRLPEPGAAAFTTAVQPRTAAERSVAQVWSRVLAVAEPGVEDDFFAAGGDSIRAVALVGALREAGYAVSVRDLFELRTIARVAAHAGAPRGDVADALVEPFALVPEQDRPRLPAPLDDAYPVGQVQLGMLVEMLAGGDGNRYQHCASFMIRDDVPFDGDALRAAVERVVARHETLRTSFDLYSFSVPLQLVHPAVHVPVRIEDLRARSAAERERRIRSYIDGERRRGLDPAIAPLLRVAVHLEPDGWRLAFTQSHALTEGWSQHSLLMEVVEEYQAIRDGAATPAPAAPAVRFADTIAAELDALADAEQRGHWEQVTTGRRPFTLPPGWAGDGPATDYRVEVPLADLRARLVEVADEAGFPAKTVLLAAHLAVLSAVAGEGAVHTGLVCDTRPEIAGADLVHGMYVNTLPVPVPRGPATWRELCAEVFAAELALWPHRRFPLPEIQRVAGGGRLINVIFNYQNFHVVDEEQVDVAAGMGGGATEFDLEVNTSGSGLAIKSNTRVLGRDRAELLAAMHRAALEAIAADLDGDARTGLLPAAERDRLAALNETARPAPWTSFEERFAEVAAAYPDRIAVGGLTYAALDAEANRLARYLRGLGAGPETVVGLYAARSVSSVLGVLAVLKAGAAYVPLAADRPLDRLAFMADDAGVSLLLTESGAPELPGDYTAVPLDRPQAWAGQSPDGLAAADPAHLAYVIYTSGSTGNPKGVLVHRAGMVNHLHAKIEDLRMDGATVLVHNASLAFDISVWQMLAVLATGGRLVVADDDTALDPLELFALTRDQHATVLEVVPSLLRAALDAWEVGADAPHLPELRFLVVTGEAFPPDLVNRWLARYPHVELVNAYGPTECSDDVTHAFVLSAGQDEGGRVPIGRPVRNTRLYVLDEWSEPVPGGVAGELYVGGAGVARGYAGHPGRTAATFLPDPYGPPGSRLYRTGDLVRWTDDDELEFLGRDDGQVKIRGARIELGEVETALRARPEIADAAAAVHRDAAGTALLTGYVVAAPGRTIDAAAVRTALAGTLPAAAVPGALVVLDALPLTPNGKIDRKALPAPAPGQGFPEAARTPGSAATGAGQEWVAGIWREVLGIAEVGADESFFDLGGDSIRAVAVVGRMRAAGVAVTVRDVFERRTVAELAGLAGRVGAAAPPPAAVEPFALLSDEDRAALPEGLDDAYPMSQLQLGMISEFMAGGERNVYHNVASTRIKDDAAFDAGAFHAAVAEIVARHEILRTSLHLTGYSVPMQLVHAEVEALSAVHEPGDLDDFMLRERADVFDFTRAPLLRAAAHAGTGGDWWLTLTFSHTILDGWSQHTLQMELITTYRRLRDTGEAGPRERGVRYADFVAGELASLAGEEDRAYWRRIVTDYRPFTPPAPTAAELADAGPGSYNIEVPLDDLGERLRARAAEADVPLKTVLLAAHLTALDALAPGGRFHTGLVQHARPEVVGADQAIGMFLSTLPIPFDGAAGTWRELLARTFEAELETWAHRRYPAPAVQALWKGGGRLVPAYFNYIDFHQTDDRAIDTEARATEAPTEFGLAVHAFGDRRVVLTADARTISEDTARRLAGLERQVLEAVADGLDGDARRFAAPPQTGDCLHDLFAEQAAATPDATAVIAGGARLSYAETERRAARLAAHLTSLGIGPDDLVGVCLERGENLLPALLGVLKAGAGYLPLDPENPLDRLAYMVADADVRVVVGDDRAAALRERCGAIFIGTDGIDPGEGPAGGARAVPDNLAYAIYTSGSTGRPKGVAVTHRNVVRLITTAQEHYAFEDTDVFSMTHSYAFDVSVFEMWGALLNGGAVLVVPPDVTRMPDELLDELIEHEVTVLSQTPTAFRALLTAGDLDRKLKQVALRAVVFAGERLEFSDLAPWVERRGLGRTAMVNMYGITETTVHTTYHRLSKRDLAPDAPNTVGRPLSDLTVDLLDEDGHPVPPGAVGEIHVSGPGVARGYLGRPGLTAARFVPDPQGPPGARRYRSGDTARRTRDGVLEFVGRIDDQVKIHGYRVELGEVEAALAASPGVRHGVVALRRDASGEPRLIGYVVPDGDAAFDPAALRERLPHYMVPSAFVELEALPLTVNGKLDRRTLPEPAARRDGDAVELPSPFHERIAALWRTVLGVERVTLDDRFFDLGGDSIRAVVLVATLREEGYGITTRELMEHEGFAELCALLAARAGTAEDAPRTEPFALLSAADRERLPDGLTDAYPATRNQVGMLIEMLASSESGRPGYHQVSSVRIRDGRPFSAGDFRRAVAALAERHEALRTSFDAYGHSEPLQLVHEHVEIPVEITGPDVPDEEIEAHVASRRAMVFDPAEPPLLSLHVHLCGDDGWQLTVAYAHAILDGWSLRLLLRELIETYQGLPARPAPAERFADTVAAELRALGSADDRAFWLETLRTHAKFELPPAWLDRDAVSESYDLDIDLRPLDEGLRRLARTVRAPLKSVMLAAHLTVLRALTPEPAFHSGLTTHVRREAHDAERSLGMHLNVLPFPSPPAAATWRELVRLVFDREAAQWAHRHFPMPELQRASGEAGRLVDVYFSYQDFAETDRDSGTTEVTGTGGFAVNEFVFSVATAPGRLVLRFGAAGVTPEHAALLAELYQSVLEAMAADPDGSTDAVLPAARVAELAGREQGAAPSASASVLERFEAQAARTPEAVAVVQGAEELTYAELDERAERLAGRLRELGARTESVVGIVLDRGPGLLAAMLASWKAGAAYLPIDPASPAARIDDLLRESGAAAVVTTDGARALPGAVPPPRAVPPAPGAAEPPDRLAYLIYTSGSTGRPKGVAVTHRSLANHLDWAARELVAAGPGGGALFSSTAFDLVVPNLWAPLLAGERVWMLPAGDDLTRLGERLAEAGPFGFLKLTPGHLEILTRQLTAEQAGALAATIVVAGEVFPVPLAEQWRGMLGDGRVVNEYGPSEATVGTCVHPLDGPVREQGVPIGAPLPGMVMRVLDGRMRRVPAGVDGELFVGGTGLARGYHRSPAGTAAAFVPDPYGPPGARLYRTGDRARWLPDGTVDFLGRDDDLVKIRGYRVGLGEIQAVLAEHASVEEAAVAVTETGDIAAFHVGAADPAELERACAERLPAYMVPASFTEVASIPLNRNGKVDRAELLRHRTGGHTRAYLEPATPAERALAAIICEVLGAERCGRDDGFHTLGGHSIQAIQVTAAARDAGLPLTLHMLYQHETLRELAAAVDQKNPAPPASVPTVPARAASRYREVLERALAESTVPGASLALIENGELVELEAFGFVDAARTAPVRADTVFQVGSLSKHVTALAALKLVDEGLDLDGDVNHYLESWRVPGPADAVPVTLRHLLGHRSGLTPNEGKGFLPGTGAPPVAEILAADVTRELVPGEAFRRANVHFLVVQQLLEDMTRTPFAELVDGLVMQPLGLRHSGFDQNLPLAAGRSAAWGHDELGATIEGRYRVRADQAAAGLWATAADLAEVVMEVRRGRLGRPRALLSRETSAAMLTPEADSGYGLGTIVEVSEGDVHYGHGGTPIGYHGFALGHLHAASGFVLLTNGDLGPGIVKALTLALDRKPA